MTISLDILDFVQNISYHIFFNVNFSFKGKSQLIVQYGNIATSSCCMTNIARDLSAVKQNCGSQMATVLHCVMCHAQSIIAVTLCNTKHMVYV